jgi:threonine dehydrogenase-like Zn-dependent dehydrogenase
MAVVPGRPESAAVLEMPEPAVADGSVLVRTHAIGICGTDVEIAVEGYGWPPPGEGRLVLGHESIGEVIDAPTDSGLRAGDLVVGIVRRPDPEPCACCANGDWDMCRNGLYVERGIKERHGYGSERFRIEPEFAVRVDPRLGDLAVLLEPATVVAKAWEQVERIGARSCFDPKVVLVTGAGPIGLLAALLGAQRGLEIHVVDIVQAGPKPVLVRELRATYHSTPLTELTGLGADVVIECTGLGEVVVGALRAAAPNAVVALAGISSRAGNVVINMDQANKNMALRNGVMFGTVNAARRHYEQAAQALAAASPSWLRRLITRKVHLSEWPAALRQEPNDIKVVVDFGAG